MQFDTTFWPDFVGQDYSRRRVFRTIRSPYATAGDQRANLGGDNLLWAYRLGWRTLTGAQTSALLHAQEFVGGEFGDGLFFLEWPLTAVSNLNLGTADGLGGDQVFDLQCRLNGDDPAASGLVITRNAVPLSVGSEWTLATSVGNNYTEHRITLLAAANNVAGGAMRASWTSARRRRHVRLATRLRTAERPGSTLWTAAGEFVETEASD